MHGIKILNIIFIHIENFNVKVALFCVYKTILYWNRHDLLLHSTYAIAVKTLLTKQIFIYA